MKNTTAYKPVRLQRVHTPGGFVFNIINYTLFGIFTLLFTWNDIIWPLIVLLDTTKYPIAIGVLSFSNAQSTNYGVTFAGYTLASIPLIVVFIFTVRRFMAGLQGSYR